MTDFNSHLKEERKTIYADMNIYRYIACGDISITNPDQFIWVYSYAHLDEIRRNGNKDALEGMKILRAIEMCNVMDENFQLTSDVILQEYVDPFNRYEKHLEAMSGYESTGDYMYEPILRIFGADNLKELMEAPDQMYKEVVHLTNGMERIERENIPKGAKAVREEWKDFIETNQKDHKSIDESRNKIGLSSSERKRIEEADSPITEILKLIPPPIDNNRDPLLTLELLLGGEVEQHTQFGIIIKLHMSLNYFGIHSDKRSARREKIENVLSDGQHVGMASYCRSLISADKALCGKATCIYKYIQNTTGVAHFEYKKGVRLTLKSRVIKH